ncbi:MAG: UDP-N-acetylmuramate dehydrogenase [bacterium]|nr:UDP-N-acetylmuramate dehydrogenase [bacterium]
MISIEENAALNVHSTMGLGGNARYLTSVQTNEELVEAVDWAVKNTQCVLPIGSGSNIIWRDEGFDGLVIVIDIKGKEYFGDKLVKLNAGENWDDAVAYSVSQGLSGLETLSLIPGTVGATPVQNVGAYGSEVSDTMVELKAYDLKELCMVTIKNQDCAFAYRTSRFKTIDKGRFIITSVTFKLSDKYKTPPFYGSLQSYLDEHNITDYSPASLRQAVIAIRQSKLPNPEEVANNGSFFANPIVDAEKFNNLKTSYPNMPAWPTPEGKFKLAAGWLVEQAGFKDVHDEKTGMAVWPKQSLVLINENASSTADLLEFRDKIINAVDNKFGITLEQEPELI